MLSKTCPRTKKEQLYVVLHHECKYWIMNLEHGRSEMEKACSKCSYCDPSLLTCLPPPIGIPNGLKWVYNYETVELENKK